MPRGTYLHLESGLEERFQCAPGAAGWRYVGERADGVRADLVVDARWRQLRVELRAPEWWVRGGTVGRELLWVRGGGVRGGGSDVAQHETHAIGFLGESPGFLVAVSRSLGLDPGGQADIRLVQVTGTALSALTVDRRWRLVEIYPYETETEPLPVARYEVADLATGEGYPLHLAGDVVLEAPGIELTDLESPPNF